MRGMEPLAKIPILRGADLGTDALEAKSRN
jgi:hypothetical protein